MTYKLAENGVIKDSVLFVPKDENNRHWQEYLAWLNAGNTPLPIDELTLEEKTRIEEIEQAPLTAKQYFKNKPAAIAFVRLTPEEQDAQIEAMTLAQLKTLLKYMAVAVSADIKREYL